MISQYFIASLPSSLPDEFPKPRNLSVSGADEFSIYTKDELRVLVAQNRFAPFTPAELCKVHEIKRTFSGRIAS